MQAIVLPTYVAHRPIRPSFIFSSFARHNVTRLGSFTNSPLALCFAFVSVFSLADRWRERSIEIHPCRSQGCAQAPNVRNYLRLTVWKTSNASLQHISATGASSVLASKYVSAACFTVSSPQLPEHQAFCIACVVSLPFSNVVRYFPACPAFLQFA